VPPWSYSISCVLIAAPAGAASDNASTSDTNTPAMVQLDMSVLLR